MVAIGDRIENNITGIFQIDTIENKKTKSGKKTRREQIVGIKLIEPYNPYAKKDYVAHMNLNELERLIEIGAFTKI